ncbi:MAG: ABC transporter substrate-binding protein [Chloroflexota bacterium]|nr:ABC transporter substrate-binding protein [Chloroflexota bacterium]
MKRLVLFVLSALLFAAPITNAQDDSGAQTLFMTFIPNVQFSPVYVALEKGYFAEADIDLAIEHGDEPLGVDLIAAGERQFGLISGEQLLTARAQERPVVFVYEWFQRYPIGVVTSVDSGIETVADLRGRRVGIPGRFGASYSGLIALLSANGLTEQDIDLQEIGFNAPEVVCIGGVEASTIYVNNEPLQILNRAAAGDCGDITDVRVFAVADDADMVSNGIITNEETIATQPELVASLVGAFDAGLRDVINNPAEAYLLSLGYVESLPISDELRTTLEAAATEQSEWLLANPDATREDIAARRADLDTALRETFSDDDLIQFEVLLSSIDLWDADQLGLTEAASWEVTQTTLVEMGFMETPLADLSAAYTNDFLPSTE